VHASWEQALRKAVQELPFIRFGKDEYSQEGMMTTDFVLQPDATKKK
jgi:hypothetical protein